MELVFPTMEHKQSALEMRREHYDIGELTIHGCGGLDYAKTYDGWLEKVQAAVTLEMSEDLVPATVYFGMVDSRIIGIIQIRHKLNQRLLRTYGHIGYSIRPSERNKGYATQMLALALEKCREMRIKKVLVTCNKSNIGSAKVIIKNGGVEGSEIIGDDGNLAQQYWITI